MEQDTLITPHKTEILNTTFLEQKSELNESALVPGVEFSSPDARTFSAADPTVLPTTTVFSKPILVKQVNWQVGDDISNTPIVDFNLPSILTTVQSPALGMLSIHSLYKTGFRIKIQVNSSPFHVGRLIAVFDPYNLSGKNVAVPYSKVALTGLPHVFIDAANSTLGHIDIPFMTLKDYFTTQNSDSDCNIGNFKLFVFNKLAIGTGGSTSVSVTIWLEPISTDLVIPVARHDVQLQAENIVSGLTSLLRPIGTSVNGMTGGILGDAVGLLQGVLGSGPNGKGKGRDHPEMPAPENSGLCYSIPNVSNGTGVNPSDRLALVPLETEVSASESHPMALGDETDLKTVVQVPMLLDTLTWKDTYKFNSVLRFYPITPTISQGLQNNNDFYVEPTFLAYCSSAFQYWRGSIKFRFEVVATQHHTGRLLVAWVPNDAIKLVSGELTPSILGRTPGIDVLSQYPCEVFDLALNKEFEFVVPYNSPTRYKYVSQDYKICGKASSYDYCVTTQDEGLGTLYLVIQNPLTHPGTVAGDVDINVFISGEKDFELRAVRQPTYTNPSITIQGALELENTRSKETYQTGNIIGVSNSEVPQDMMQGSNKEMDLKFLLKRYYPSVTRVLNPNSGMYAVQDVITPVNTINRTWPSKPSADLLSYFSRMYRFWTGGINYLYTFNTSVNDALLTTLTHDYGYFSSELKTELGNTYVLASKTDTSDAFTDSNTNYSTIHNLRVNPHISVTPPYRSVYTKLLADAGHNDLSLADGMAAYSVGILNMRLDFTNAKEKTITNVLYRGAADDFRLFYLVHPPQLYVSSTTPAGVATRKKKAPTVEAVRDKVGLTYVTFELNSQYMISTSNKVPFATANENTYKIMGVPKLIRNKEFVFDNFEALKELEWFKPRNASFKDLAILPDIHFIPEFEAS